MIHSALYRHIYREAVSCFTRFARVVWDISPDGKAENELAAFIKETGLPAIFTERDITDEGIPRSGADICTRTVGFCEKLERDESFELLKECL